MSESTPNTQNGGGANPNEAGAPPSLIVAAQYLKDLSFENPRAPAAFNDRGGPPKIAVDVNVNARGLENNLYEVELSVSASARHGENVLFVVETTYAGAFDIRNVPADQLEPIMLIECPRILFPFLRQIVADATRNGNFPPLMLEPIDFFAVYQQRMRERPAAAGAEPATA